MIDRKSKELKNKIQQCCNNERAYFEKNLSFISFHKDWGTNIENDIANCSERNISKGVQQLIKFKSQCSAIKTLLKLESSIWKNYKVVHFQKNGNKIEYSSLMGDIVVTYDLLDSEKSSSTQTASDRRASCVPAIQHSSGSTNIGPTRQSPNLDGIHRSTPY